MEFYEILRMLSGPVVGATIGYVTNMIAVKMLFYPRREIRLLGKRLPLTPGVIPKGRPRLAASVGGVIENHLLTKEAITEHLLSEQAEKVAVDAAMSVLSGHLRQEILRFTGADEAGYEEKKSALCHAIGGEIVRSLLTSGATDAMLNAFADSLTRKYSSSPMRLLINERTLPAMLQPARETLQTMIETHGEEYVTQVVESRLTGAGERSGLELLRDFDVDEAAVREYVTGAYRLLVERCAEAALRSVNVSALVERKINSMPIEELERLVQDVMKKELNAIISLGALIGFFLGLINIFIR